MGQSCHFAVFHSELELSSKFHKVIAACANWVHSDSASLSLVHCSPRDSTLGVGIIICFRLGEQGLRHGAMLLEIIINLLRAISIVVKDLLVRFQRLLVQMRMIQMGCFFWGIINLDNGLGKVRFL